ncbi:MAG: hypothetical protein HOP08_02985 [Cyclobacteriaceae bacterium]|nr:hypothetical protein [Cyclobacteriaceae bacterium]
MDILAAFFLFGLLLSGLKALFRHLWDSGRRFSDEESLILTSDEVMSVNLLSATSNETLRRDHNYIRITSSRDSNENQRRLSYPGKGVEVKRFKSGEMELQPFGRSA